MSTVRQLVHERGVLRMRRPIWASPTDHVQFKRYEGALLPWATLWSPVWLRIAAQRPATEENECAELYRQSVLVWTFLDDPNDDWEPYDGPECLPWGEARAAGM